MRIGSLFSGIGGLELGLETALRDGGHDVRVAWQCEADEWCRGVLAQHWPDAKRYNDIRDLRDPERVDVLCGGFPCQDLSYAGKGAGLAGERSGLWREYARLVRKLRPRVVVVENVAALLARGVGDVLGDLAESGYDALWTCVRASDVGAPHRRDRLFLVAWLADSGRVPVQRLGEPAELAQAGREAARGDAVGDRGEVSRDPYLADADVARLEGRGLPRLTSGRELTPRTSRPAWHRDGFAQPRLGGNAHGFPARLDAHRWPAGPDEQQHLGEPPRVTNERRERRQRLKALGNAVVPQVGYVIGCLVCEVLV